MTVGCLRRIQRREATAIVGTEPRGRGLEHAAFPLERCPSGLARPECLLNHDRTYVAHSLLVCAQRPSMQHIQHRIHQRMTLSLDCCLASKLNTSYGTRIGARTRISKTRPKSPSSRTVVERDVKDLPASSPFAPPGDQHERPHKTLIHHKTIIRDVYAFEAIHLQSNDASDQRRIRPSAYRSMSYCKRLHVSHCVRPHVSPARWSLPLPPPNHRRPPYRLRLLSTSGLPPQHVGTASSARRSFFLSTSGLLPQHVGTASSIRRGFFLNTP
ncbi:hypothetical protein BD626DRAFT_232036 [Schizophyllum amplum]|uniref:Uncharacterized protein n=1 Tax=Schizophyllum amplum TaxID=97359 RepID=A0A550BWA2_9AGAR|nr:hypothetical protein BD626DRAFT_232036 [Auriculariopsis ampla]